MEEWLSDKEVTITQRLKILPSGRVEQAMEEANLSDLLFISETCIILGCVALYSVCDFTLWDTIDQFSSQGYPSDLAMGGGYARELLE